MVKEDVKFTEKQVDAARILGRKDKKYVKFWGSGRSGKSFLICYFIRQRARKYAGSKHLIARYSFANAKKTIWLETLKPLLKEDEKLGICKIKDQAGVAEYFNGSTVILGGLEPSRIDSVLAIEYATIFVTEANENKYSEIETLYTRLNDTSCDKDGNMIPLKFICDLNPTKESSWTNLVFRKGIDPISRLQIKNFQEYIDVHFKMEDNKENLQPGFIESQKSLSPGKRLRFYEGKYGGYEGLVIPLDEEINIVNDFDIPEEWDKARAIDFGFYPHPFACSWLAWDKSNDLIYLYREYYGHKITVSNHAKRIIELSGNEAIEYQPGKFREVFKKEKYEFTVSDHDAEDRETLHENGVLTVPADKRVIAGLDRLDDLRPNLRIFRSCVFAIEQCDSYRYKDEAQAKKDREVVKEDDDIPDTMRYYVMRKFPVKEEQKSSVKKSNFFS